MRQIQARGVPLVYHVDGLSLLQLVQLLLSPYRSLVIGASCSQTNKGRYALKDMSCNHYRKTNPFSVENQTRIMP